MRTWIEDLYKKFTREERTKLARRAKLAGIEVSVKYRKADGSTGVSGARKTVGICCFNKFARAVICFR